MEKPKFTALITVKIEGQSPDEFGQAMSNAFDVLSFGSTGGSGITPNGTSYTCNVESNLPSEPMTFDRLLGMVEEQCDPEQRQQLRDIYGDGHVKDRDPQG